MSIQIMSFRIIKRSLMNIINDVNVPQNMHILSKALYESFPLYMRIKSGQKYLSTDKPWTNINDSLFRETQYARELWADRIQRSKAIEGGKEHRVFAFNLLQAVRQRAKLGDIEAQNILSDFRDMVRCRKPANNTIIIKQNQFSSTSECILLNLEDISQFFVSMMLLNRFPKIEIDPITFRTPYDIWYHDNKSSDQSFDDLSHSERAKYIKLAGDPLIVKWLADAYILYCQIAHNCKWMTIMPDGWQPVTPGKRTYDFMQYFIPKHSFSSKGSEEYEETDIQLPEDYSQPIGLYPQWKYFLPYDVQMNLGRISSALFARFIQFYGEIDLATTDPTVPEMYRILYRESVQNIVAPFLTKMIRYLRELILRDKILANLVRDHVTLYYNGDMEGDMEWYTPYVQHLVKLIDTKYPPNKTQKGGRGRMPPRNKKYFRSTKSGAGMTRAGVMEYRRLNPGSKLSTAVTGRVKPGSRAAKRRKSYCARSAGQMRKFPKAARNPNSRLRQARRRWKC